MSDEVDRGARPAGAWRDEAGPWAEAPEDQLPPADGADVAGDDQATGPGRQRPVLEPGSTPGWGLLALLALPALAYAVIAVRDLTGHGRLFEGLPQDTYNRIAALALGAAPVPDLLASLLGLALVAVLPASWSVQQRRAGCGLAGLVAVEAGLQAVLLGYLWVADAPSNGSGFSVGGSHFEQLSGPVTAALAVLAVAGLLGVVLAREPVARTPPGPAPVRDVAATPAPAEEEPPPEVEQPEVTDEDPYARYRRPGP